MTARCEVTELPVDGCAHCRDHERPHVVTPAEVGLDAVVVDDPAPEPVAAPELPV